MSNWELFKSAFRTSRLITYSVFLFTYIYTRFFYHSDNLCNHGFTCPFCGLRTAMYYIEHGRFADAFNSNKLCVLVVLFFAAAVIDLLYIVISYLKKKKA
jgi:hypothetical protein